MPVIGSILRGGPIHAPQLQTANLHAAVFQQCLRTLFSAAFSTGLRRGRSPFAHQAHAPPAPCSPLPCAASS